MSVAEYNTGWEKLAEAMGYASVKQMLEAEYGKKGLKTLCTEFNVSQFTLRKKLTECGIKIKKRGGAVGTKIHVFDEKILDLIKEKGITQAAAELGVSVSTLFNRRKQYRLQQEATSSPSSVESENVDPKP